MKRITDTINVEGKFMDEGDDDAGFTLNAESLACWWRDPRRRWAASAACHAGAWRSASGSFVRWWRLEGQHEYRVDG